MPDSVLARHPDLASATRAYVERGRAPATVKAHRADWQIFTAWCAAHDATSLPATIDTIVGFLVDCASSRSLATIRRYRSTVSKMHKLAGFPSLAFHDQVRAVLHGIAVEKTERSPNAKAAATADVFRPMLEMIAGEGAKAARDRAILLVGAVTGMRSAELVAVNVEDLTWHDQGVSIFIRRSKTDQTGVGRYVAVPCVENEASCAVHALKAWLLLASLEKGPLFRSFGKRGLTATRLGADRVADIVKGAASAAGLDPAIYAAHSLRSGYVTQARREGLSFAEIMEQTGHRDLASVKRYARDPVDPFRTGRVREVARAFARAGAGPYENDGSKMVIQPSASRSQGRQIGKQDPSSVHRESVTLPQSEQSCGP